MKEQISCVTSRRFVRAAPRQHVDGRAPDAAACSIILRADRDGALALFVVANRNGLLWPTFSSAIGSILCLSVSLDLLPSLPMNTEWTKKYVPPRCRAMSCQGQCQAAWGFLECSWRVEIEPMMPCLVKLAARVESRNWCRHYCTSHLAHTAGHQRRK